MCDMQNMPTREDASCEEDSEMNFATFSAGGAHYVTGAQLPVAKLQQGVPTNGTAIQQQVVGMVGGDGNVQYVRAVESGALQHHHHHHHHHPQLISVPIALPGHKPGDPQPTVQIQVLSPSMLQAQQQPKYQMQIPIQGFQQGGAVLTLAYSPEANETGGLQLLGNALADAGLQMVSMPQDMQLLQPTHAHAQTHAHQHDKEQIHHQVFITPNQQIIINNVEDGKLITNNNDMEDQIVIKEECEDQNDDESSQGTEASDSMSTSMSWSTAGGGGGGGGGGGQADLLKYLNTMQPQQAQALPVSLQQFLRLNPAGSKKVEQIEIEVSALPVDNKDDDHTITEQDGVIKIQKKKKKYKKKPPRPARPKPGQVTITQTADGTSLFCCPECHMAYADKEQLETHLVIHKIERRFICGICGAGLKRKEHLERHKLGHNPERPFVCGVCRKGFKRREHLNLHAVIHSGVKTELCLECGKGFYRKDHLRKHTRSHEHKRARDEAAAGGDIDIKPNITVAPQTTIDSNTILPEITIHVPTSANVNVPVQINIPQHVVSSLAAAQQQSLQQQQNLQQQQQEAQTQLDALLASHT